MSCKSKTYCPYPFIGASLQSNGITLPCGQYMNIKPFQENAPIEEIRNNTHMQELRFKMLNNMHDSGCQCPAEEKAGLPSMREAALKRFGFNNFGPLQVVEIFFDNVCNLKCRSCASPYSHLLYDEEKLLYGETLSDQKYVKNTLYKTVDITALKEVNIYGGEPLLSLDCEEFFSKLLKESLVEDMTIFLSTNGTVKPKFNTLEAFKKCNVLQLNISIDGYGKLNEFIRSGSDWDIIVKNLQFYQDLKLQRSGKTILNVHSAVSVYNINKLEELHSFIKANFPHINLTTQVVQFPQFLSIKHLPKDYKEQVLSTLNFKYANIDGIIEYLNSQADNYFDHFINYHNKLNEIRKESFDNSNPMLSEYIDNYKLTNTDSSEFFIQQIKILKGS